MTAAMQLKKFNMIPNSLVTRSASEEERIASLALRETIEFRKLYHYVD